MFSFEYHYAFNAPHDQAMDSGSEGLGLDCQMTPSQSQSCPFTCKYELHTPNYSTFFDIFCNSDRS
jgi:hypothetical protein